MPKAFAYKMYNISRSFENSRAKRGKFQNYGVAAKAKYFIRMALKLLVAFILLAFLVRGCFV